MRMDIWSAEQDVDDELAEVDLNLAIGSYGQTYDDGLSFFQVSLNSFERRRHWFVICLYSSTSYWWSDTRCCSADDGSTSGVRSDSGRRKTCPSCLHSDRKDIWVKNLSLLFISIKRCSKIIFRRSLYSMSLGGTSLRKSSMPKLNGLRRKLLPLLLGMVQSSIQQYSPY